VRQSM